jgi:hypothetical protein
MVLEPRRISVCGVDRLLFITTAAALLQILLLYTVTLAGHANHNQHSECHGQADTAASINA